MHDVEKWLKETNIPYAVIARDIEVSKKTVYNWVDKINKNKKLSHRAHSTLEKYISKKSQIDYQISSKVQKHMDNQDRFIELQHEKIEQQKQEISELRKNQYPIQSEAFHQIVADMESFTEMKFVPIKRKIVSFDGHEKLSQRLGINVLPYFDLNKEHDFNSHPIEKLITKHTREFVDENMKILPRMFDMMKKFLSEHYITIPVIYKWDEIVVHTLCYCKIHWSNPTVVHTKVLFMNGEKGKLTKIDNS